MGTYNTIVMSCPSCGADVEEQSKAGDCMMRRHVLGDPEADLRDVGEAAANTHTCGDCGQKFRLFVPYVFRYEKVNADDDD